MVWHDHHLVDGGVADNTPLTHAVELGASEIYVLPTGSACALAEPPHGAVAMMVHAITVLIRRRMLDDILCHVGGAELTVLPPPCPLTVLPRDFSQADALITTARADARAFLDGDRVLDHRHTLRPHQHAR